MFDVATFWNDHPKNGAYHTLRCHHQLCSKTLLEFSRLDLAKFGERLVGSLAHLSGWITLYHGLRHQGFELDLVLSKNRSIKIIEVKTVRDQKRTPDLELISGWMNFRKNKAIQRGAYFLLQSLQKQRLKFDELSCDLMAVNLVTNGEAVIYRWPQACSLT